ncbi:glycosyltransferase family 2 protein, partial [Escherichia coli]
MFSIIIPSFNREKQLRNALAELNKQLYKEFEVIVVDDASDSEYDLSLDLYHFELKYFRSNKNLGPSGARNIGVSLARYDWIIFLDDDDYFMPEKLMILRETILNNDIDFIYHRARIFMINEKISYISSQKDIDKIPGEVYQHMLSGNFIGGPPNFAIKKSLFNKLHGFSDNVRAIEDYEFLLRLVRDVSKKRIIFVDNVLTGCNYITKSTSVSKNINNLKQACTYISEEYIRDNRE